MTDDLPKISTWKHARPFRLGDFEVLPASGELLGRRGTQRVRPLLMDILLRLSAQPGEVVRRETLLEDVWPRRMVNDEVLSRAIAELRTALGDDARDARYIETLPKIGYRLLASVREPPAASALPAEVAAPSTETPSPRRALPWVAGAFAVALAIAAGIALDRSREVPGADLELKLLGARPFTSDPGRELNPRFSHDGKLVAFALFTPPNESRIVVQSVGDSARKVIGDPGTLNLSPVFLPGGERLAYWRIRGRDCAVIVEHTLASGAERTLVDCDARARSRFDVSRDGRWIAYAANPRPQFPTGLHLFEVETGKRRALTSPEPGMGDDLLPRFSPDGKRIAFFRGSESHSSVWIVDRDEPASAKAASKLEGLVYGAAWLGNEGPLLVAADWLGFRALNRLDPATGEARLVGARGARAPDVGPNGEILYENAVYAANFFRVSPGTDAKPTPLWHSTRYSNQPEFSPDGRRVVFVSNRDGVDGIYVSTLDGEPRRVAGDSAHRYFRPHWSADGRFIYAIRTAVQRVGPSRQEAVRIAADGGSIQALSALGGTVNDVRETRDGRSLLWAELSGYAMRILRAPINDVARVERLPWPLASQLDVNGDRVVLAQPEMTRLMSCRLSDLACEPLPVDVAPADLYDWTLGPRSLFFRSRSDGGVVRYDFASGRITPAASIGPSGAGTSLAASPDEGTLLVTQEEGPAVDLMIAR